MKKRIQKRMAAAGLAISLLASPVYAQETARPSTNGRLHVEGRYLKDDAGNVIQLRGISSHGIAWFPDYINEACIGEFSRDWNANVFRLAMYTAEYNGYCTGGDQETLKQLVRNGIEYATKQDMYVIVDWHVLSDQDPNTYADQAKIFFEEICSEYADHENVLYEICNEPNGNTTWDMVKAYAREVIPVIRKHDSDAVILVGTPNWCQFVDQAAADPITEFDNIMYTLHYYAATHKEDLRWVMKNALDSGLPLFVSEYGICDASGNGGIDYEQADQWISMLDENQVSYVAWNLSNKEETSAIIQPNCTKTSGFTQEDLSMSGKWLYSTLTGEASY